MIKSIKQIIKRGLNLFGIDMVRKSKNPENTLLGLKNLPIRTIIDVGANRGQFAQRAIKIFHKANIYCFEPLPEPFNELKRWADKQSNGKITAFNMALGDNESTLKIINHVNHSPSSSFLKSTKVCERLYSFTKKKSFIKVKQTTLDKWTKAIKDIHSIQQEMLIKLDVQGYEDRVIQGGIETFQKARACVLEICLDKLYENQATFKKLFLLLDGLGYHYAGNLKQIYADDGHIIYIDTVFVKKEIYQ